MKYESTILKRLIDTYGVVGNPRYISEIIKEFIVRGKECFPNLFTYQADWLAHIDEFGLNPTYTVSYTGQSIYAPNTLEKPIKSAILKGQTLVNISPFTSKIVFTSSTISEHKKLPQPLNQNTKYILIFNINNSSSSLTSDYVMVRGYNTDGAFKEYGRTIKNFGNGRHYILLESTEGNVERIFIASNFSCEIDDTILAIYQDGMENWDIPYFEGMQSVKLPVLTTSNEDGTKTNILTVNEDVTLRGIGDVKDELDLLTGEVTERIGEIVLDGNDNWYGNANFPETNDYKVMQIDLSFPIINATNTNILCDKIRVTDYSAFNSKEYEFVSVGKTGATNVLFVKLNKSKLISVDKNGFNDYFSKNPTTVCFTLSQNSDKTVDLTILDQNGQNVEQLMSFNGGTHFTTSSQDGSLLPTLTVDVVTDLEKTLMVCSLEGNTM